MRTAKKYDIGTTFKHPWIRNQTDKKPTTCIVSQIRDGVIYFRGYRPNRTLGSWTGELSEAAFETHIVLSNALRAEDDIPDWETSVAAQFVPPLVEVGRSSNGSHLLGNSGHSQTT